MTDWELEDAVVRATKEKGLVLCLHADGTWAAFWDDQLTLDGWSKWMKEAKTLNELFIEILRIEKLKGNPLV